ncbi:NAD-dependent epimerase/dehydratase family protein [Homoserinimonas sp. A520]
MTEFLPRSVLVTGGNGFIGAWVVKNLLDRGEVPVVFDVGAPSDLMRQLVGDGLRRVRWIAGDICDTEQVRAAVSGADAIVHLAGVLTPFCIANPVEGAKVNIIGTTNILDAARQKGIAGVAYASSAAVYSSTSLDLAPVSLYGAFKFSTELIAGAFHRQFGLNSMGLRPLVVYGPGRETGSTAGISLACRAAALGEPFEIEIGGRTDAVFVADVADAFVVSALDPISGAHSYSVSGEVASIDEIIEIIRSITPEAEITSGSGDVGIHADVAELDLRARRDDFVHTSLRDGLAQTIDAYRTAFQSQPLRSGQ